MHIHNKCGLFLCRRCEMWPMSISRSEESYRIDKYTLTKFNANDEQINDMKNMWTHISNEKDIFLSIAYGFCSVWRSFGSHSYCAIARYYWWWCCCCCCCHRCYSIDLFSSWRIHSSNIVCFIPNDFVVLFYYFFFSLFLSLNRINNNESMGRPIDFINDN